LFFAILFLVIYYIRPQDWVIGLVGFQVVKPIILLGLFSLLNRERSLAPGDFFKTPLDWAVLFYAAYIVLTSSGIIGTAKALAPVIVFYWLTVLALDSEEKIMRYMKWWTVMLLTLAGFGVAQLYGVDFTGGQEITDSFNDRLSLGTWTHNNPNALGHSVVVAIPMVYFLLFWKSTTIRRVCSVLLILLAAYAAKETESKGAFLVGGGAVVLAAIFGRPKFVQILILAAALAGGGTLLAMLPRMDEMQSMGSDEGVQGRMLAWEIARTASRNNTYGEGYRQFQAYVRWTDGAMYPKATHSSYVRIGADLGYPGLFFFLLILWCNLRVLITLKTDSLDLERCRRMLFLILATYAVSGWMIDRSYHTEYFLLAACCAALHRLQLQEEQPEEPRMVAVGESNNGDLPPSPHRVIEIHYDDSSQNLGAADASLAKQKLQKWNRLGFIDVGIAVFLTWLTLETWDYLLKNI
jgi:hypothetical protein